MTKVPGRWEHMSLVWDELKTAKSDKSDIVVVWLDIANAYGSVPHQLVFVALERYGVSQPWIKIIKSYYEGLWSRYFSNNSPSSWHKHLRGIFTGRTSSMILFLSAMNINIEYICAGAPKLRTLKPNKYCFVLGKDDPQTCKIKVFAGKFQHDMTLYVSKSNIDGSIPSISN